jgi:acetate kinase
MAILCVNAGSSSLKFSLHLMQGQQVLQTWVSGCFEGLEPQGQPTLRYARDGEAGQSESLAGTGSPFDLALGRLARLLDNWPDLPRLRAVSHRVVHGGPFYSQAVIVDDAVLGQLATLNSLAPLHQPHNLAGIRAFQRAFAHLPQVACFDTAFHANQDPQEQRFALPAELQAQGVRRYGFHGLSYQFIMQRLSQLSARAPGRVIMAHLGNGASLCGAHDGRSRTSTMGFSALDGLIMGTRSGALDPGVLLYLMEQGWSHDRIQRLLYKQSGLLGLSGLSADMRTLRASASPAAAQAIDLFERRVVRECGAVMAVLGGLDVLAFSGGIGEHDASLRQRVCRDLSWLGVQVDESLNRQATGQAAMPIHTPQSRIEVWVIPTDEGSIAAQEAGRLLS